MKFENNTDHFDQHFLVDGNVINTFIKSANLSHNDDVIEIGPGNGILTKRIAPLVKKLTCIELDQRLYDDLSKIQEEYSNVSLIFNNVLNIDIPKCNKIITAVPYSIIEPLMFKLVNYEYDAIYMIMGKHFVDNVLNKENTRLSLFVNSHYNVEKIMDIAKESFKPMPRVESSMIKITKKNYQDIKDFETKLLYELFYRQDRKVKNALKESLIKINNITQKAAKQLINQMNIEGFILEKTFETCSNDELNKIVKSIVNIES